MERGLLIKTKVVVATVVAGVAAGVSPAVAQAAPPNDERANAAQLAPLPRQVRGTTVDATTARKDPRICAPIDASVWYRIDGAPAGTIVLRLQAAGKLDAAIGVFRSVRSEARAVDCARTNDKGLGEVSFSADKGDSFLILVGERMGSDPGAFRIVAFTAEPPARAPGDPLPPTGGAGTVSALGDADDSWRIDLRAGQTYRINLVAPPGLCPTVGVFRTRGRSFGAQAASVGCDGYRLFTPGVGDGGRYSLVVHASSGAVGTRLQRYRLRVSPAGPDDMGPGVPIGSGHALGRVSAFGVDVEDLYRFDVARRGEVKLALRDSSQFDVFLLSAGGRRLACVCGQRGAATLRQQVAPGQYLALVRAGRRSSGAYGLSVSVRELTSTTLSFSSQNVGVGGAVTISVHVATAAGPVNVELDRYDALQGWVFARLIHVAVGLSRSASIGWTPPSQGRWRARAAFAGTVTASPSTSSFAFLGVGSL
jgi:hypothetical protein